MGYVTLSATMRSISTCNKSGEKLYAIGGKQTEAMDTIVYK